MTAQRFPKTIGACALLLASTALADDCANAIPAGNPSSAYIDNGDGTATDTRTGLMWKRCSEGQSWSEETCTGDSATMSWQDALAAARSSRFAGRDDWRLPNVRELRTLVELCRVGPAINQAVFPNTDPTAFWTSTPSTPTPGAAWYLDFHQGISYSNGGKPAAKRARLVRSVTPDAPPPSQPESPDAEATERSAEGDGPAEATGKPVQGSQD